MTHQEILDALIEVLYRLAYGKPVDAVTLYNALEAVRLLDEKGFQ